MTNTTQTPQEQMISTLRAWGNCRGHRMEALHSAGAQYFVACRGGHRTHVHVALDGSLRYSDSERFGEIWHFGISG